MTTTSENPKILKSLKSSFKSMSIDMDTTFITFNLKENSKYPSYEWSKDPTKTFFKNKHMWRKSSLKSLKEQHACKGIPCGKINKFWVLDLDFYYKETDETPWTKENCEFTKVFGDIEKYIKDNNIYSVKSISGGLHLYFTYDPVMKQTSCKDLHIDTRSDGGYIVAPYTMILPDIDKLPKDENGKQIPISKKDYRYNIFNLGDIKPCPEDLKDFVLNKVINKDKKVYKKITNNKIKVINPINEEVEEIQELDCDLSVYTFAFTDDILNKVCETLPDCYFQDYSKWLIFTTAMKTIDRQDIWDEWSKKRSPNSYNEMNNLDTWFGINNHNKLFCVNHILLNCKLKNARSYLDYFKYKPVPKNNYKPHNIVNYRKLGQEGLFCEKFNDRILVIQSDTGTGKTTEFKNYIKNDTDRRFISIVSRISLGKEQTSVFQQSGIDCYYHEEVSKLCEENGYFWGMFEGDNIVITIDSLMKLDRFECFDGYTLFLDEFNSLMEYLITCPLLKNVRKVVYSLFRKLLRQVDRVICADADINEISLRYLDLQELEYNYIKNEYKHNSGIPAEEIFSYETFMNMVSTMPKWLICCDSKSMAEVIGELSKKPDITYKIITSETTEHVNLDDYDRCIYSPKIVYGIDSSMERPVFCYFKEHTISPVAMIQQLCRNRNITKLYYMFTKKKWELYKYHDYEQIYQNIIEDDKYGAEIGRLDDNGERLPEKNADYLELLSKYMYRTDCYNTNKFAHFINIIQERGFDIVNENKMGQTSIKGEKEARDFVMGMKQQDYFDICRHMKDNCDKLFSKRYSTIELDKDKELIESIIPEYMLKIQEILKIDWDKLSDYHDIFCKPGKIEDHFAISLFHNKCIEEIKYKLHEKQDYNINKTTMIENKLLFIHKFRNMTGLNNEDINDITCKNVIPEDKVDKFIKEFKIVFERCSVKKFPDFKELKHNQEYLVKMYNNVFGKDYIKKKKSTKKGKSITYYNLNDYYLAYNQDLYKYRSKEYDEEELPEECMID